MSLDLFSLEDLFVFIFGTFKVGTGEFPQQQHLTPLKNPTIKIRFAHKIGFTVESRWRWDGADKNIKYQNIIKIKLLMINIKNLNIILYKIGFTVESGWRWDGSDEAECTKPNPVGMDHFGAVAVQFHCGATVRLCTNALLHCVQ